MTRPELSGPAVCTYRNRTWVSIPIDERMLCATLFRDVCGDSSLLLSTVVSLPCEVSTEALISDLELTRVSVDQFTVETINLTDGCHGLLIGSVLQGLQIPLNGPTRTLSSRPRIRVQDSPILSSRMPRPRMHIHQQVAICVKCA